MKSRRLITWKNLPRSLRNMVKKRYPNGIINHLEKIVKANKESLYVLPLETEDAFYMIIPKRTILNEKLKLDIDYDM